MSERKLSDVAAEAVIWSLLADVAKERKDAARAELTERMGAEAVAVKAIANGVDVGRVTWVESKPKLVVTNERALLAFVEEHYPTETLTTINPAFQRALFSNAVVVGDRFIDSNGVPIPGVEMRMPEPYVSVRKSAEARATVEALLDKGRLNLDGITQPQLEGQL